MEQITVRLSTEVIEELDRIAEESDRSRAEVIRDELNPGEDADEVERLRNELAATRDEYETEIKELKAEYESEIEDLKNENERLQRQLIATNKRVEEHTDLVRTVERQQSLAERKARAGLLTKTKWALFGMSDEDE